MNIRCCYLLFDVVVFVRLLPKVFIHCMPCSRGADCLQVPLFFSLLLPSWTSLSPHSLFCNNHFLTASKEQCTQLPQRCCSRHISRNASIIACRDFSDKSDLQEFARRFNFNGEIPPSVLLVGNPSLPLKGFDIAIKALTTVNKVVPISLTWICQTQPSAANVPELVSSGLAIDLYVNPSQVSPGWPSKVNTSV